MINRILNKYYRGKIKSQHKIEGYLQDDEALKLFLIAKSLPKNANIIEIGSWKGKSTFCLAKGLKNGKIYAIDPFNADGDIDAKKSYTETRGFSSLLDQFKSNLSVNNLINKIEICQGYSIDFIDKIDKADFIFIDGDHSIKGCEFDFLNYHNKLTGSKIIALHDYYPDRLELGPTYVINKYIINNPEWEILSIVNSLLVAKKK